MKGDEVCASCFISQQALFSAQLGGSSWCWHGGNPSSSAALFAPCKTFPARPKTGAKCVLGAVEQWLQVPGGLLTWRPLGINPAQC